MTEQTIIVPMTAESLRDRVLAFAANKSFAKSVEREYLGEIQLPVQTPKPPGFDENAIDEIIPEGAKSAVKAFLLKLLSPHNLELVAISIDAAPENETAELRGWQVTARLN